MYFLDKLWQGNIHPGDRMVVKGSEYEKLTKELCREIDILQKIIPEEAKKILSKVEDLFFSIRCIEEEAAFIKGFRLGAGMILDVTEEYDKQIKMIS